MAEIRRRVRAGIHLLSRTFALLAATCVVALMLATTADVTRRAATGRAVRGVVEYSEVLMVALVFLGLAYAQHRKEHVAVSLFMSRVPRRTAGLLRAVGLLVMIAFVAWMFHATLDEALRSLAAREYRFGLLRVPVWPARLAIPIGLAALAVETLIDAWDVLTAPEASELDDAIVTDSAQAAL